MCDSHEHEGAEQRVGQLLAAGASPNTTDEVRGALGVTVTLYGIVLSPDAG